jgi:hypothetical protein
MPLPAARPRAFLAATAVAALVACARNSMYNQPEGRAAKAPRDAAATLSVPPGQLPPPGLCRVWFPGRPPGRQPKARPCSEVESVAPAGAWVLYRPSQDQKVVHVRYLDDRRAGVVVWIRVYDASSGAYIRDVKG